MNTDQIKKLLVDSLADFLFSNSLCLLQRRRIKTCGANHKSNKVWNSFQPILAEDN